MTYLNKLSDTDLETPVEIYGNQQARAEALFSIIIHTSAPMPRPVFCFEV